MTGQPSIEVIVLTGFLGSGKTTLLRDLLARPETTRTAVIVNEAGEIGLDGAILRESSAGLSLAMLANGCICCQMGSDLADTVRGLVEAGPLDRIILETSGLSRPGPVLRQLAGLGDLRLRAAVLATFDAARGADVAEFAEAAAQWAAASRIVATRMDLVPPERHAAIAPAIAGLNPLAEIVVSPDRAETVTRAFAPLLAAPMGFEPPETQDHPRIAVRLARPCGLPSYDKLTTWLDNLAGALGDRLLRVKGLVPVQESAAPLLIQSVGTLFSPPRPFQVAQDAPPSHLVLMVRDLAEGELERVAPCTLFTLETAGPSFPGRQARRQLLRAT